jgi:hypothetical protein
MKYKIGDIIVVKEKCSFHRLHKDELAKVIKVTLNDRYYVVSWKSKFRSLQINQTILDCHIKGKYIQPINSNIIVL